MVKDKRVRGNEPIFIVIINQNRTTAAGQYLLPGQIEEEGEGEGEREGEGLEEGEGEEEEEGEGEDEGEGEGEGEEEGEGDGEGVALKHQGILAGEGDTGTQQHPLSSHSFF